MSTIYANLSDRYTFSGNADINLSGTAPVPDTVTCTTGTTGDTAGTVFTLRRNGDVESLTTFMQSGVVNSASTFQTSYHMWNADTRVMDTNMYPESYNKGDTLRKRRREFNERMDGLGAEQKGNKPYPKPYRLYCSNTGLDDHYGDKIRIFAKCVSSARPHEMMDIMLMTQSL